MRSTDELSIQTAVMTPSWLLARVNACVLWGLGALFGWLGVAEFADGVRHAGWSGHIEQLYSVLELGLGTLWILLAATLVLSGFGLLRESTKAWWVALGNSLVVGLNALLWLIEYVRPFPVLIVTLAGVIIVSLAAQRLLLREAK